MDKKFSWYNPVAGVREDALIPEDTWNAMHEDYEANKARFVARSCTDFETYVIMVLWMNASK